MINLVMSLNVCSEVDCTLTLFERERWRDSSQMLSIQPIGQIAVHIAVSLIDLFFVENCGRKFQIGGVRGPKT